MRTPHEHQLGMVAILDALGASSFGEEEIDRFIDSQEIILQSLNEKADAIWGEDLRPEMVTTFTFNDTIVIALTLGRLPDMRDSDEDPCKRGESSAPPEIPERPKTDLELRT